MDSYCATLKPNGQRIKLNRETLRNRSSVFWGESMKASSLKGSRDLKSINLQKILKTKPGVAYSILTSDVEKEALVSESKIIIWILLCGCFICFSYILLV